MNDEKCHHVTSHVRQCKKIVVQKNVASLSHLGRLSYLERCTKKREREKKKTNDEVTAEQFLIF